MSDGKSGSGPGVSAPDLVQLAYEYLFIRPLSQFGVDEPPSDPAEIRDHLDDYRPPKGRLLLAECEGKPAGVGAYACSATK
jgi:hypothetical protein